MHATALLLAGLLAAAPTVTGCGTTRTAGQAGGPPPPSRQLTLADGGRTITMRPGETVEVVLGRGWHLARAATSALRRTRASGGFPTGRPGRALFVAAHRGTSAILSASDARCLHTRPRCMIPQRLWRVVVYIRSPGTGH